MKSITMFETSWCPYCKQARTLMKELMQENPKYKDLDIKVIDEELHPKISSQYNYYYVPTFFIEEEKAHEGVPSKDIIREIFEQAI